MEPIITVGAIGRLHLKYGWPVARLAVQSPDWAYDIVALGTDGKSTTIAGEVKKTRAEVDDLIDLMAYFGSDPCTVEPTSGKYRNAFKKVVSLRKSRAPLLWLIGPARYEQVMTVEYRTDDVLDFELVEADALVFGEYGSNCARP